MRHGKPCHYCGVGWMKRSKVADLLGRWWWVWYCGTCNHSDKEPVE